MRITPGNITELKNFEVIVFGSNAHGYHLGGLAKVCVDKFGAIEGRSFGLQGQSFGINTMSGLSSLIIDRDKFLKFAKQNTHLTFLLTEIGCGIAGYTPEEIAPLFIGAVKIKNIYLPESFWKILDKITIK